MVRRARDGHGPARPARGPAVRRAGRTRLSGVTVSPRSGTPSTIIKVTVIYQNANGSRAEQRLRVVRVDDRPHDALTPADRGARASRSAGPASCRSGDYPVVITAKAKNAGDATLAAGSVTISAPARSRPPSRRRSPADAHTDAPRRRSQVAPDAATDTGAATRHHPADHLLPRRRTPFPTPTRSCPTTHSTTSGRPVVVVPRPGGPGSPRGGPMDPAQRRHRWWRPQRWLDRPGRRVRPVRPHAGRGPLAGILAMVGFPGDLVPGPRARPDARDHDHGGRRGGHGARPLRSPPTR